MANIMICPACKKKFHVDHFNQKRCRDCASKFRKNPQGNLSERQKKTFYEHVNKIPVKELAEKIGVSVSTVKRFASQNHSVRGTRFYCKYKDNPDFVRSILDYYVEHGKRATLEKFPGIKLRSIVERYSHKKRQTRWKENEIINTIKTAGIISYGKVAKKLNRPNAHAGSVRSFWSKKMNCTAKNINGISFYWIKPFLKKLPDRVETDFRSGEIKIILWVDIEKNLRKDVPEHLRSAIGSMVKFQKWLHGKNVRHNIRKMIEEYNEK